MGDLVTCDRLSKRFGGFHALTDCTLGVRRGEIFGLLGPNGAGKTTLIRLLLGFLHPSSGKCEIDGIDPVNDGIAVRRCTSYLPGDAHVPRHMRGRSVLRFFAEMHPDGDLDRSLAVADRLELDLKRHVAFMSTGMRQKLALSVVLGPRTPLLILDEPTANLDPSVRSAVLDLVTEARDENRTVMFSSHVLSEIEQTCDRVVFLRRGRLVRELEMTELAQKHRITAADLGEAIQVPDAIAASVHVSKLVHTNRPSQWKIDTVGDLSPLLSWLDSLSLSRVRIEPLGLRSVYDDVHNPIDGLGASEVTV